MGLAGAKPARSRYRPCYSTLVGPLGRGAFITRNLSVSPLSLYQQCGFSRASASATLTISTVASPFNSPTTS